MLLKTYGDDISEERQALRVELFAVLDILKFRTQTGDDLAVAGILRALCDDQGMGIALLEQIFRLVDLISGVDSDQYRA